MAAPAAAAGEAAVIAAADTAMATTWIGMSKEKKQLTETKAVLVAWGTVSDPARKERYEGRLKLLRYALVTTAEEYGYAQSFMGLYPKQNFTACIPMGMNTFAGEDDPQDAGQDWTYVPKEYGEAEA